MSNLKINSANDLVQNMRKTYQKINVLKDTQKKLQSKSGWKRGEAVAEIIAQIVAGKK